MPDLGTKHECLNCGVKFYDLGGSEAVCPKCGANQKELEKEGAATKGTSKRAAKKKPAKKKPAKKSTKKSKKELDEDEK